MISVIGTKLFNLMRFSTIMEYKGLKLDDFQEEAIRAIEENKSVVVSAPTGSGKTLIADYVIERDLKNGLKVIYTAPIKALSNQKYKQFCRDYGESNVGLITGDTSKNPGAPIVVMTTEIYRNMVLASDPLADVTYIIFDEIHCIADIDRGYVWEESIIFSSQNIRMLCLSATIPNADELAGWISTIKSHEVAVIRHDSRPVPLHLFFYDAELGITTLKELKETFDVPDYRYVIGASRKRRPHINEPSHIDLIKDMGDNLPCLFFCFSRSKCQKMASELAAKKPFVENSEITGFIRKKLMQFPEIGKLESAALLRRILPLGIGFHHSGLMPVLKEIVEELFASGMIKVLYTTETFAVGINMPAKSVVFESLNKFDGHSFRMMNSKEYFQIAGRAGRRGIDREGFVYIMVDRQEFQPDRVQRIIERDREPLNSRFRLSVNTALNLVKKHNDEEIETILKQSFDSYQRSGRNSIMFSYNNLRTQLEKQGFIHNGSLTEKGQFASKVYADETVLAEIFATPLKDSLDHYQILLIIACICHENDMTQFYKTFPSKQIKKIEMLLEANGINDKRFSQLENMSAIMKPCQEGVPMLDVLSNTSMQEGDLLRLFKQIIDRLGQVENAAENRRLFSDCKDIVIRCIQNMDN